MTLEVETSNEEIPEELHGEFVHLIVSDPSGRSCQSVDVFFGRQKAEGSNERQRRKRGISRSAPEANSERWGSEAFGQRQSKKINFGGEDEAESWSCHGAGRVPTLRL